MIENVNIGDIVYLNQRRSNAYLVKRGVVDDIYSDGIAVSYLTEHREYFIDGIPVDKYEINQRRKKLPKGWTYNTKLFKQEVRMSEDCKAYLEQTKITDRERIKEALQLGYLIREKDDFHGVIEEDITKEGYKIIITYPMWKIQEPTGDTVPRGKLYDNYMDAKAEADAYYAELKRRAELSDKEWSIEEIDGVLERYAAVYGVTADEKTKIREKILSLDNIEYVETRIYMGQVQWRYENMKRWNPIETNN